MPSLNDDGSILVSKKIKYDDEMAGLYFDDYLHFSLNPSNFQIIKAYSELQKRNIDFKNKNAKNVIKKECLSYLRTLAILQKENLLENQKLVKERTL